MFELQRCIIKTVIVLGLLYGSAVYAVSPFVVKDIRLEGLHGIEPTAVFAYLPLARGDTFTDEKSAEIIHALYATGFFNDVRVAAQNEVVVVQLSERPIITQVDFSGIREFDKENLTKALRAVDLSQGRYYDKSVADKAEQELKRQYLSRGYYAAHVRTTITPVDRQRVAILFSVAEGPSAKIRQVNFIGNTVFSTSTLQDEMRLSTPNWFSWYTKNDLYSREKFAADLESIRSYYLNRGYLEFTIESTQVSISPDKKDMYLTVTLHEGKPYTVSSIELTGNVLGKAQALNERLALVPGDYFSAEKLQASTKAIADKLGEYGYAFATVTAVPDLDKLHQTVKLTLQIEPGRRVYVRRINISGNTRTRDEVIRREMRQFESAWFDSQRLKLSQDRVNRLGYFTQVDANFLPVEGVDDQVDVELQVAEKATGAIMVGAGFSSTDRLMLSAGVSQDNVFGSGTSLAVNVNTSQAYRTLTVTQIDPYFTVDGIKRITNAYYRTFEPLSYSSASRFKIVNLGADLKFGVPFSETDMVYFGLGFDQTRMNPDAVTPQSYKNYINEFGRTVNNIPLTIGWSRDNRDSALVPGRGYYLQANVELGTPAGATQYYKSDFQAQYYYSFSRGFVLGLNAQAGYGHGLAGKTYPIFKNYLVGGIGSVRGYRPNSLGPHDVATNDPIGGSTMVVGNVELTFPLPGTGYDRTLRVFTFLDGGNVWGNLPGTTGTSGMRYGYGLGLAWISPVGPLKISFGFPVVKHTGDEYQKFQFQIGTAF